MYLSSPLNEWHGRKSLFYAHKNNGIKFHPDNKFGVKKEYENFQAQTLQLISNLGFTLPKSSAAKYFFASFNEDFCSIFIYVKKYFATDDFSYVNCVAIPAMVQQTIYTNKKLAKA